MGRKKKTFSWKIMVSNSCNPRRLQVVRTSRGRIDRDVISTLNEGGGNQQGLPRREQKNAGSRCHQVLQKQGTREQREKKMYT